MTTSNLAEQHCQPCDAVEPLSGELLQEFLGAVDGWQIEDHSITKLYEFADFPAAIQFVNRVAELAEAEWHHPDIAIAYNKVTLTLATHTIGGLSPNDFILAAKIDQLVG